MWSMQLTWNAQPHPKYPSAKQSIMCITTKTMTITICTTYHSLLLFPPRSCRPRDANQWRRTTIVCLLLRHTISNSAAVVIPSNITLTVNIIICSRVIANMIIARARYMYLLLSRRVVVVAPLYHISSYYLSFTLDFIFCCSAASSTYSTPPSSIKVLGKFVLRDFVAWSSWLLTMCLASWYLLEL